MFFQYTKHDPSGSCYIRVYFFKDSPPKADLAALLKEGSSVLKARFTSYQPQSPVSYPPKADLAALLKEGSSVLKARFTSYQPQSPARHSSVLQRSD